MDIGLYQLKTPFRKLIDGLVPWCKNVDPNLISLWLIPLGILTAWNYILASWYPIFFLVGILLIFLRMILATLDGLVAITYSKSSSEGEMINRIAPEICDFMLLGAVILSNPDYWSLGLVVLIMSWATSFFGLIGLVGGRAIQSVGPVGQTDRLVALMVFSLLHFIGIKAGWQIDFMRILLYWLSIGGCVTVILRCSRIFTPAKRS